MVLDITYQEGLHNAAKSWLFDRLLRINGIANVMIHEQVTVRAILKSTVSVWLVLNEVRALVNPKFTFSGCAKIKRLPPQRKDGQAYQVELTVMEAHQRDLRELAVMAEAMEMVFFADVPTAAPILRIFMVLPAKSDEPPLASEVFRAVAAHCGVWLRQTTILQ